MVFVLTVLGLHLDVSRFTIVTQDFYLTSHRSLTVHAIFCARFFLVHPPSSRFI